MIEETERFSGSVRQPESPYPATPPEEFVRMQQDVISMRAVEALPALQAVLQDVQDERITQAMAHLKEWDGAMEPDSVPASIFDVFFRHWSELVAAERFEGEVANLMAGAVGGLSLQLLSEDKHGWFAGAASPQARQQAILTAMNRALAYLEERLGPDMSAWRWGQLHTITLRHYLSGRGELSQLLDRGKYPVGGQYLDGLQRRL